MDAEGSLQEPASGLYLENLFGGGGWSETESTLYVGHELAHCTTPGL
jgi:hypothetical protein